MAAISADILVSEVTCFACLGLTIPQQLEIALMRRWLLALDPGADVSVEGLMNYGKAYGCCFNLPVYETLKLALLDLISQAA